MIKVTTRPDTSRSERVRPFMEDTPLIIVTSRRLRIREVGLFQNPNIRLKLTSN